MKICPKCKISHEKSGTFCSRSCANSRPQSAENNKRRSDWAKANPTGFIKANDLGNNLYHNKSISKYLKSPKICIHCNSVFQYEDRYTRKCKQCNQYQKQRGGYRENARSTGIKGWYKGYYCDSLWELVFIIYHLDHGSKISRNKNGFPYIDSNGKQRLFYPDFILDDQLIEIKGRLIGDEILKKEQVQNVTFLFKNNLDFAFNYVSTKYSIVGSGFASLYDNSMPTNNGICKGCGKEILDNGRIRYCSRSCGTKHVRSIQKWSTNKLKM